MDMHKQDIIDQVASRANLTRPEAVNAVEAMLDTIVETLGRGEDVRLVGFGKFTTTHFAARVGTNPKTGEKMQIAATSSPKFTASSKLKNTVKSHA